MMARAGNLFLFAILAAVAVVLYAQCRRQIRKLWESAVSFMNEGKALETNSEESKEEKGSRSEAVAKAIWRRRKFRKSMLNKAKILIATWQIAASTETVSVSKNSSWTCLVDVGPLPSSLSADLCEGHEAFRRARSRWCPSVSN
jgi:hypothetical protein